ncbi:Glycosyltransferase [Corynebacterium ulcerans]|uniref:Glycosyltransferase n=1 Tax=Corynebacterium ulcerans FRC58 TaxID=1408268 RepID=A0ABN4GUH6_CORUL|nr:glycosyltransferase family 4 protein [Corynebacterium ulcerans]AIT89294.1 Glycosyltransferase [Corynebacterium ulcerans]AIU30588.1 Glycosyltransferase [Corynebacterium ulcerans]AIU91887.1 Glycosyltransferase [Corynebacterium ulcerans]AKN77180.1 Glycosyltransferase [Corynebacterium ulcerans FRC58]ALD95069.1 Glycosyltransferase [Corynebacterium ulcerans]
MRIGIVCPYSFDEPGGVQAHILDLARKLIDMGHYVGVIGPCTESTEVPDFVTKGGRSWPIPYNGSVARLAFSPKTFRQVREFIQQGKFDVLHIHEPNSPSFSLAALKVARGPIVATYHASSSKSTLLTLALPFLRGSLEKIRGGIAVSEMARRWQVQMLGGDPVSIPNGVDTSLFAQARKSASLKSLNDPVEIVFLGRIDEPRKGLDILLRAVEQLDCGVHVTVIGGGTQRHNTESVEFVGRVSEERKAEILGAADIYVAPNTGGESFGIVLVEAMAAGCAVVASDLEAFHAVCDADSPAPAGLLFRNGDASALASALRLLIDAPDRREQLAKSGEARAQQYDWERVASEIVRVYETVADGTKVEV